jgi:hypothetical protein
MRLTSHTIVSGIISVGFVVIVQIFAAPQPVFRFLLPAFLLFVAVITTYNYFYLKRIGLYNFWSLMRIVLFLLVWF